MGKYIRKPKTTRDVAVKDVSQSYLGVRTRARTLALQRLQSSSSSSAADAPPPPTKPDFLELRSRRLEKPPLGQNFQNSRKPAVPKQGFVRRGEGSPRFESSTAKSCSEAADFPIEPSMEVDGGSERLNGGLEIGDSEIEASLGENNLDLEARERGTRESTPCSFIRPADSVTTPGSSTRQRSHSVSNPTAQNVRRDIIPSAREMDEFFAQAEKPQQRRFIEKYNFDIVNDMPLPGRYEWVKVMP